MKWRRLRRFNLIVIQGVGLDTGFRRYDGAGRRGAIFRGTTAWRATLRLFLGESLLGCVGAGYAAEDCA